MSASPTLRQTTSELRLRGNIIKTAPCWVVWHNVHSQQHTHVSRSSRLGLSHWDPYAMHRGGCLELYYCNIVEWSWWNSGLICKTNWLPSVLWHCWFGHMTCEIVPDMTYNVFGGTLNLAQSVNPQWLSCRDCPCDLAVSAILKMAHAVTMPSCRPKWQATHPH